MPIQDLAASPIENDSTADSSDVCFLHTSPLSSGTVMHINMASYPIIDAIV